MPPYRACLFLHYPTLRHSSNQTAEQPIGKENAILKGLTLWLSRLKMRVADRVIIFRHMAVSAAGIENLISSLVRNDVGRLALHLPES